MQRLAQKKEIAAELKQLQTRSGQRFALKDLLSVPMQRMLKYPLLLKELIGSTKASHPEYGNLRKALLAVQDVAKYINETKRDNENLETITQLQHALKDYEPGSAGCLPLIEYGKYVIDGDIKLKLQSEAKPNRR